MNKVLVTGLATEDKEGFCSRCHYDLEWLLNYPSLFLWADHVLVPETIWDLVHREVYPAPTEFARSCRAVFDIAHSKGLIEIVKPSLVINHTLANMISSQVDGDMADMARLFPDKLVTSDRSTLADDYSGEILLDGEPFCTPYLSAVYANLILARAWGANCLFDARALHLLRYKFGISGFPKEVDPGSMRSFTTVFEPYLPNDPLLPHYALCNRELCSTCKHEESCADGYLHDLEERMTELLKWRDYDEVHQAKAIMDAIVSQRDATNSTVDPDEIAARFHDEETKLRRRVLSIFPKVKRWANVATIISIPIAVAGLATDASLVTIGGAIAGGFAQLGKEYVEFLESKYRWVGFHQNMLTSREEHNV